MNEWAINFDNMDADVERLRRGCMVTRKKVIEGFMPLGRSMVNQYIGQYPWLQQELDDLYSETCVRIIQAIDTIMGSEPPKEKDNIVGYVSTAILSGLNLESKRNRVRVVEKFPPQTARVVRKVYETDLSDELFEFILSLCNNDRQRTIIKLRKEGLNDTSIGEQLGLSQSIITRERCDVERRFNDAQSS